MVDYYLELLYYISPANNYSLSWMVGISWIIVHQPIASSLILDHEGVMPWHGVRTINYELQDGVPQL